MVQVLGKENQAKKSYILEGYSCSYWRTRRGSTSDLGLHERGGGTTPYQKCNKIKPIQIRSYFSCENLRRLQRNKKIVKKSEKRSISFLKSCLISSYRPSPVTTNAAALRDMWAQFVNNNKLNCMLLGTILPT